MPKKLTVEPLSKHASSSLLSRSSSALSARRKYLYTGIVVVIKPYYNLFVKADDVELIDNMSALRSFFVPHIVAVTNNFKILTPNEMISLSLRF